MAVFTAVTEQTLSGWLDQHYDLGRVVAFRGIPSGIENSNFFVTTERDGHQTELVLTLFERLSSEQLPFYLHLMEHLAARGVTVPAPAAGRDGLILRTLNGKPATLVSKLPGRSALTPGVAHCQQVGAMLARMHLAGRDYPRHQPNLRGLPWWEQTTPLVEPFLNPEQLRLIQSELAAQQAFHASEDYAAMPSGPCHCDLFRDNVLFDETPEGDQLGGFFDFYFAGCDKWLFDVAVTVNDWCIDLATGELDMARASAMLRAYATIRPFTPEEARHWRMMLRAGALRFWISRLWDFHLPRDAQMLKPHDPTHFERVLIARIAAAAIPWVADHGDQRCD